MDSVEGEAIEVSSPEIILDSTSTDDIMEILENGELSLSLGSPPPSPPHLVISQAPVTSQKKKKERKSVKAPKRAPAPYARKELLNQETKEAKPPKAPKPPKDPRSSELRNELKLLILKHAEATQMSEVELKKELTKAARVKENDLPYQLDLLRLKVAGSWTKELACSLKNGTGLILDKALGGKGFIAREFQEDTNLEHAIHGQMEKIAFLMDPKIRIGLLTAKDVVQGYSKKVVAAQAQIQVSLQSENRKEENNVASVV